MNRVRCGIPPEVTLFRQLPKSCLDRAGRARTPWRTWEEDILTKKEKVVLWFLVWLGLGLLGQVRGSELLYRCTIYRHNHAQNNPFPDKTETKQTEENSPIYILLNIILFSTPDVKMRGCATQHTVRSRDSVSIPVGLTLDGWIVVRLSTTQQGGMTASTVEASCR